MMQGTGVSKSIGASSTAAPPPPPIRGVGLGPRATMADEKEKARKGLAKKKLPTAKEMVAHYESQGMQPQEASLKVIDDLQNLLLRVVNTSKKNNMDAVNNRLLRLESKLDSKPGFPQTLAIGVLSGTVVHVFPQVISSVAHIWNSVRSSTSST
ncbi:unnamed protein product [Lactuca virosa]|uniref:Uncharacterized protein n=1 Tax=Lactuca virosa TaxID=75947 RepID=A0AAU9M734_9ASTR|nr:unnamed protein product [Lactuca virosa]